jgi:hypothetical protein
VASAKRGEVRRGEEEEWEGRRETGGGVDVCEETKRG